MVSSPTTVPVNEKERTLCYMGMFMIRFRNATQGNAKPLAVAFNALVAFFDDSIKARTTFNNIIFHSL
ncbi:hypothetical protein V6N13_102562 [Hibiscus sabdariffa]